MEHKVCYSYLIASNSLGERNQIFSLHLIALLTEILSLWGRYEPGLE